jgi:hypothetical protein
VRILGVAFEQVCIGLRTGDFDDDVKQAIADKIIDLSKSGERILIYYASARIRGFYGLMGLSKRLAIVSKNP